jgi:fumarylacetoacetase
MALARSSEWLGVPADHHFGLQTLPYGSFSDAHHPARRRVGVAIGDHVLDLTAASQRLLPGRAADFAVGNLDRFLAAGDGAWAQVREALTGWLSHDRYRSAIEDLLVPADTISLHLPFTVADYVDFYASEHHATNVGRIFRPDGEPLTPNWRHLPIGYHGRSGTVVVSGTPIRRPWGQTRPAGFAAPIFGVCRRLDFEAELGFVVGVETVIGEPVPARRFAEHVFGACLVNDWSARDIQAWEYQPLGPFLSKSFATSLSPWVVTAEALAPFRVPASLRPAGDPQPLPYLDDPEDRQRGGFDVTAEVYLQSAAMREAGCPPHRISRGNVCDLYWTFAQMLAHHTSNGCDLRPGDLLASGTISGPAASARGCLLEMTHGGAEPLLLPNGERRTFLEDGDEVRLRAFCQRPGAARIGFGECVGTVLAAAR